MNRIILVVSGVAVLLAAAALVLWSTQNTPPTQPSFDSPSFVGEVPKRYVFNVVLHKAEEIDQLLHRAEELAGRKPVTANAGIALVLHGPEIEFFRRGNYTLYKATVDRARRLKQAGVIEIKMCRTQMRALDIRESEIPDFVEIVPYGPSEIGRLKGLGYVSL